MKYKLEFTRQELKAIEFVIVNDLETLQDMIRSSQASTDNIGEYANLSIVLGKVRKELNK